MLNRNGGIEITVSAALLIWAFLSWALFGTVVKLDEKNQHDKKNAEILKIAPEDKLSNQVLYTR